MSVTIQRFITLVASEALSSINQLLHLGLPTYFKITLTEYAVIFQIESCAYFKVHWQNKTMINKTNFQESHFGDNVLTLPMLTAIKSFGVCAG